MFLKFSRNIRRTQLQNIVLRRICGNSHAVLIPCIGNRHDIALLNRPFRMYVILPIIRNETVDILLDQLIRDFPRLFGRNLHTLIITDRHVTGHIQIFRIIQDHKLTVFILNILCFHSRSACDGLLSIRIGQTQPAGQIRHAKRTGEHQHHSRSRNQCTLFDFHTLQSLPSCIFTEFRSKRH